MAGRAGTVLDPDRHTVVCPFRLEWWKPWVCRCGTIDAGAYREILMTNMIREGGPAADPDRSKFWERVGAVLACLAAVGLIAGTAAIAGALCWLAVIAWQALVGAVS